MSMYTRKPYAVRAVQWRGDNITEVDDLIDDGECTEANEPIEGLETASGEVDVQVGDWIVKDESFAADLYMQLRVLTDDEFRAAYEPVPEPSPH